MSPAKPSTVTELDQGAKDAADAQPEVTAPDLWERLRDPFPPSQIGKLPKGGTDLDYVGHGAVTDRLLHVDPLWNWEPFALDADGLPKFTVDAQGNPIAFWIRLTVGGVTRPGVGTCGPKQFDAEKVLIGDALRNAAMRFGVALDLWVRGQAEDDERHATSQAGVSRVVWNANVMKQHILKRLGDEKKAKEAWRVGKGDDLTEWSEEIADRLADEWIANQPAEPAEASDA